MHGGASLRLVGRQSGVRRRRAVSPVKLNGKTYRPGQANNFYIYPAMGLAIFATEAKRAPDALFVEARRHWRRKSITTDWRRGCCSRRKKDILAVEVKTPSPSPTRSLSSAWRASISRPTWRPGCSRCSTSRNTPSRQSAPLTGCDRSRRANARRGGWPYRSPTGVRKRHVVVSADDSRCARAGRLCHPAGDAGRAARLIKPRTAAFLPPWLGLCYQRCCSGDREDDAEGTRDWPFFVGIAIGLLAST